MQWKDEVLWVNKVIDHHTMCTPTKKKTLTKMECSVYQILPSQPSPPTFPSHF